MSKRNRGEVDGQSTAERSSKRARVTKEKPDHDSELSDSHTDEEKSRTRKSQRSTTDKTKPDRDAEISTRSRARKEKDRDKTPTKSKKSEREAEASANEMSFFKTPPKRKKQVASSSAVIVNKDADKDSVAQSEQKQHRGRRTQKRGKPSSVSTVAPTPPPDLFADSRLDAHPDGDSTSATASEGITRTRSLDDVADDFHKTLTRTRSLISSSDSGSEDTDHDSTPTTTPSAPSRSQCISALAEYASQLLQHGRLSLAPSSDSTSAVAAPMQSPMSGAGSRGTKEKSQSPYSLLPFDKYPEATQRKSRPAPGRSPLAEGYPKLDPATVRLLPFVYIKDVGTEHQTLVRIEVPMTERGYLRIKETEKQYFWKDEKDKSASFSWPHSLFPGVMSGAGNSQPLYGTPSPDPLSLSPVDPPTPKVERAQSNPFVNRTNSLTKTSSNGAGFSFARRPSNGAGSATDATSSSSSTTFSFGKPDE